MSAYSVRRQLYSTNYTLLHLFQNSFHTVYTDYRGVHCTVIYCCESLKKTSIYLQAIYSISLTWSLSYAVCRQFMNKNVETLSEYLWTDVMKRSDAVDIQLIMTTSTSSNPFQRPSQLCCWLGKRIKSCSITPAWISTITVASSHAQCLLITLSIC